MVVVVVVVVVVVFTVFVSSERPRDSRVRSMEISIYTQGV